MRRLEVVPSTDLTCYPGGGTILTHGTSLTARSEHGMCSLIRVIGKQGDGGGSEMWDMGPEEMEDLAVACRLAAAACRNWWAQRDADGEA